MRRDKFYQILKHYINQQQQRLKKNIIEIGMNKNYSNQKTPRYNVAI